MNPMTVDEHHQRLLEQRRLRVVQLSVLDGDPPGRPGSGLRLALTIAARSAIREIDQALDRIDAGTYGVCASCHGSICPDLLAASPTTLRCTGCRLNEQNCHAAGRLPLVG